MNAGVENKVEQVVEILLQVGERVVEVSREQVMTRIWDRPGSPLSAFKSHYTGRKVAEIRNDSTITRCRAGIDDAFATGNSSYVEYISYNNDSNTIAAYSFRVLACHPDKDYVFLVIENITRGNENILVEDKWKLALDASDQGVWDANLDEKTIFFSEKWQELFGYSAKEISKLEDWQSKVFPADKVVAERKLQQYISGQSPIYSAQLRYLCKDGSYKWILSRGVVISRNAHGSPSRFIGTHMDISELKKAEEDLRRAKETFANSFNYSGIGKALIAPGGIWLEVNNVICELTGYTKNELYSMHYNDITYPDDIGIDISLIQKLLAKEIPSYTIEKRYVAKDRRVLTTVITVTLVRDGDDRPLYFICDIVDETAKKAITDELLRKNQELETASENLLSKISQLEELNHIIAHNLRGPASSIKMLSSESEVFSKEEALEMIHASSSSLLNNLDMMVEMARIKLDKHVANDTCNIKEIINNITTQLQGIIYQKDVRFVLNLTVKEISYPKIYLESILYNLISNAIKYRRDEVPLLIEITTKDLGDKIILILKDNGLGIDLEKYGSKVFKLNQTFHHGYDSKGVGLFITKTQIESMGGSIELKSKLNEGSEFVVTILK